MTTMDRPRSSAGIRPGLLIPEIENDLTRRDFLTGAGSLLVLEDVGFSRPEAQRFELSEDDLTSAAISEERIPDMDGDAIFVGSVSDAALENLRDNPLWQRLEAVREGRVYEVGQEAWIFPGPSAADSVLDDIEKSLA